MQPILSRALLDPRWFFAVFALMWVAISALLSLVGGWSSLASHFRSERSREGERFRFVSGSMGAALFPVSYGRCLFLTVSEDGFGLSILFPFRLLSPPLFIPWRDVESVESRRFLFVDRVAVKLRDRWQTIAIRGAAGERLQEAHLRATRALAPAGESLR
jgi:hypothetical protein